MWTLLFGFICVGLFHESSIGVDSAISSPTLVAIAGEESCCGTNMSQHVKSWRDTFLTVSQGFRDTFMLLALGIALAFVYSWLSFRDRYPALDPYVGRYRLYIRENPDIPTFNHLKLAFALGILNPKLY